MGDRWRRSVVTEVMSGMVVGVEGQLVKIQTDISDGLPVFTMIGHLSNEVREARDRVRTALKNCGCLLPARRISVNLAPGDTRKYGTWFDLAIAVSLLTAMGHLPLAATARYFFLGELSLDGRMTPSSGILPIVREAVLQGHRRFIVPEGNGEEAALIEDAIVYAFSNLQEVIEFLTGAKRDPVAGIPEDGQDGQRSGKLDTDFRDIHGQAMARRAMEIAAAGFHNVFLTGPPGMGKSMLAAALPGILPEMTLEERIETSMIYSVKGLLKDGFALIKQRPFRAPSLGVSQAGMFGGGAVPSPGEVSLAHHGVLFIDEFNEHSRSMTEMLRIPLENHAINLVRHERTLTFPADFLLVAAANPCPCGYYPDRTRCRCMEYQIQNYQSRLSGPIMDRMDIFVRCDEVSFFDLTGRGEEESSASIRRRVEVARAMQMERRSSETSYYNGRMTTSDVQRFCRLTKAGSRMMEEAFVRLRLTGRSYYKLLKTARTIADLDQSGDIKDDHLMEAICYRQIQIR